MWSLVVLAKYWAIQLPSIVLAVTILLLAGNHLEWPQWIVWTLAAAWVAKDAVLYPFVWRAYAPAIPRRGLTLLVEPGRNGACG